MHLSMNSGSNLTQLFHATCQKAGVVMSVQIFGRATINKILEGKKMTKIGHNLFTTFNFDRKYLRKGSTKQISEKHVINYNPSFIRQKGW